MLEFAAALIPSVGVGLVFWFALRAIISADRGERAAVAQFEREEKASSAAESRTESSEN